MAGVLSTKVFFRYRKNNTAAENSSDNEHCKKHCCLAVGLEKVVFRGGNCQGNQNYEPIQLNTSSDCTPKLKTNMVKPRNFISPKLIRTQTEQFFELFSRTLNFFARYICENIIVYYCFDRTRLF